MLRVSPTFASRDLPDHNCFSSPCSLSIVLAYISLTLSSAMKCIKHSDHTTPQLYAHSSFRTNIMYVHSTIYNYLWKPLSHDCRWKRRWVDRKIRRAKFLNSRKTNRAVCSKFAFVVTSDRKSSSTCRRELSSQPFPSGNRCQTRGSCPRKFGNHAREMSEFFWLRRDHERARNKIEK